jgi:phage shock protein A
LKGIGSSSLANFQRYEEKINEMADQSEALQESLFAEKQLEREFEQLESSTQVADELESLKTEMETEEQKKKEEMEKKKLEQVKIKLDSQVAQVQPAKRLGTPQREKLKEFFGE